MPKGGRLSRVLDEEFSLFEADGSRGVWRRYLLGAKGHQRPFPILDDHVELLEDIVDGSMRSESGQLGSPASADAPCVLVDRLNDVFGRIMVCPLVSHVVVGRSLCRNVALARCVALHDVDDCTETCVCMWLMLHKWPVRITPLSTFPLSTSCPQF